MGGDPPPPIYPPLDRGSARPRHQVGNPGLVCAWGRATVGAAHNSDHTPQYRRPGDTPPPRGTPDGDGVQAVQGLLCAIARSQMGLILTRDSAAEKLAPFLSDPAALQNIVEELYLGQGVCLPGPAVLLPPTPPPPFGAGGGLAGARGPLLRGTPGHGTR